MSNALEIPSMPQAERKVYTYEMLVAEMPETNQPHELWDGELIMAAASSFLHQIICRRFCRALEDHVLPRELGEVVDSPIDMVLSQHRVVQPDVAFVAKEHLRLVRHAIRGAADLVAEVISLGCRNRDRIEKRDLYEQYGVKEYWIIDPEPRTIDVLFLTSGSYELVVRAQAGETARSRLLPGFEILAEHLFRE